MMAVTANITSDAITEITAASSAESAIHKHVNVFYTALSQAAGLVELDGFKIICLQDGQVGGKQPAAVQGGVVHGGHAVELLPVH